MASIERTAYPRFKPSLTANELQTLYGPTDDERALIATHARGDAQHLTVLILLKCQQHLRYLPALADVPEHMRVYLCQQLHLLPLMSVHVDAEKTLYRYRHVIRTSLDIKPYEDGGKNVVETAVQPAASTMSDPADLLNLAVEYLLQQRCELPAFRTLDRLVMHVRHRVHQGLYTRITASLEAAEMARLDALLHLRDGRTDFTRSKETPRQATLKHLRQWTTRLTWLEAIFPTRPFLTDIAHTKVQQCAAEAAALDVGDMRDIHHQPRRYSLLLYKAFSELGRVERTLCLLDSMSDADMRQHIRAKTPKVESYHQFTDWIAFGGPVLRSGDPVEQEKRIKYRDLVANAVMLHNVVDMTNVLRALQQEGLCVTPEIVRRLSPYLTEHIKRFGQYFLDMATQPEPLQPKPLFVTAA